MANSSYQIAAKSHAMV